MKSKHTKPEEVVIPELEELVGTYKDYRFWTEEELAIVRKYFRKVSTAAIAKQINRTVGAVENKGWKLRREMER